MPHNTRLLFSRLVLTKDTQFYTCIRSSRRWRHAHVCETSSRKQTKQTTMCIWGGFLAYSFAIISRLHSTSVVHRICTPYLHRVFNVFFSLAWSSSSRSQKNAFFRASSSSLSNQEQARVVINSIGETTNQIDTRRNA